MRLLVLNAIWIAAICVGSATAGQRGPADTTWSPLVDGVRGRLVATLTNSGGKPQCQIDLELENGRELGNPIEIWWHNFDALLEFSLEDEMGVVLPRLHPGGNVLSPQPYWLQLPYRSMIRITISRAAYEYLPDGRIWLRPVTFQGWDLTRTPASPLYLRATLTPTKAPDSQRRIWVGPLSLPRVRVR